MQGAALHHGLGTEHLAHRGGQGFGAVDDHQQPIIEFQAALDQVGQQGAHHGLIFGGAIPHPDGLFGAVDGDRQCDHHTPLGHMLAIQAGGP